MKPGRRCTAPDLPHRAIALRGLALGAALVAITGGLLAPSMAFETFGISWRRGVASYEISPGFPVEGASSERVLEVLRGAADTWREQTAADFRFVYDGTTSAGPVDNDGRNVVSFSDDDGNGALAVTFVQGFANRMEEFDMVFFARTNDVPIRWELEEPFQSFHSFDFWGVAVHEFGHALGLDHTEVGGDPTMRPAVSSDGGIVMRTLEPDDIAGVEALYGTRSGARREPTLAALTPASGPASGGGMVTIEGANFTWNSDTTITVGDTVVPRAAVRVDSATRMTVLDWPRATLPEPTDVTIENSLGNTTLGAAYEYTGTLPVDFVRGDVNFNGVHEIGDPLSILLGLFRDSNRIPCADAADVDDNGAVEVADAVSGLAYLFLGGPTPRPPFPVPGEDPTEDSLGCASGEPGA